MGFISLDGEEFVTDTDESFDQFIQDLPWGNKWVKKAESENKLLPVLGVLEYPTGLMIVTKHYKAYLKPGENGFSHLKEALDVWTATKSGTNILYVMLTSKGFPKLAINDEEYNRRWAYYGDRWIQNFNNVVSQSSVKPDVNPLLAGGRGTGTGVEKLGATTKGRK